MILSHKHKFIYLHIPKTGGISAKKTIHMSVGSEMIDRVPRLHSNGKDSKEYVKDKIWNSYYKFSIVRNPFARLVSWFLNPLEKQHKIIKNSKLGIMVLNDKPKGNDKDKKHLEQLSEKIVLAKRYIKYLSDKSNFPEMIKYWKTKENQYLNSRDKFYIFQNQIDWLGKDMNCILKLENIGQDWNKLISVLKIPYIEFQHKNKQIKYNYREYYNDKLIDDVSKIYRKDLDYFGYGF